MSATLNSVTVVGSGFVGDPIALHCAAHGKFVRMYDTQDEAMPEFLDRMTAGVAASTDPFDKPPKILLDKIARGHLGEKTGRGFYAYPNSAWKEPGFLNRASV